MPRLRGLTTKTPNPRSSMRSPRFMASFIASKRASTATSAFILGTPVFSATLLMMSSLITDPPAQESSIQFCDCLCLIIVRPKSRAHYRNGFHGCQAYILRGLLLAAVNSHQIDFAHYSTKRRAGSRERQIRSLDFEDVPRERNDQTV